MSSDQLLADSFFKSPEVPVSAPIADKSASSGWYESRSVVLASPASVVV